MDVTPSDQAPAPDPYQPPLAPIGQDREGPSPSIPGRSSRRPHLRAGFLWASALVLAGGIALLTICSSR